MRLPDVSLRWPASADAVQVDALNGIADPNQTSLYFSGLSVDPVYVGAAPSCIFTVAHAGTPLEIFPATDYFAGLVADAASGLVVGVMPQIKVTLDRGTYTEVRLTASSPLPSTSSGGSVRVAVAPASLMATAQVGQSAFVPTASLQQTVAVQAGASPSTPPPSGTGGGSGSKGTSVNPTVIPGWVIAAGAGVVVIGGAALLFRHGPAISQHVAAASQRSHERQLSKDRNARAAMALEDTRERAKTVQAINRAGNSERVVNMGSE